MRIAVYTLTRDRLEFTRHCFKTLEEKAGYPYDHFVIDNGSEDGTPEWLKKWEVAAPGRYVLCYFKNLGISVASNKAIDTILSNADTYDLVIKFDNDCEVLTCGILVHITRIYEHLFEHFFNLQFCLSPRVMGIVNQPKRLTTMEVLGYGLGKTSIIGGLMKIVPAKLLESFRYKEDLPLAWGQDDQFSHWVNGQNNFVGYIENLCVNHYLTTDGQAQKYPEYFERKRKEEKIEKA